MNFAQHQWHHSYPGYFIRSDMRDDVFERAGQAVEGWRGLKGQVRQLRVAAAVKRIEFRRTEFDGAIISGNVDRGAPSHRS
jgi:hypothetical protein